MRLFETIGRMNSEPRNIVDHHGNPIAQKIPIWRRLSSRGKAIFVSVTATLTVIAGVIANIQKIQDFLVPPRIEAVSTLDADSATPPAKNGSKANDTGKADLTPVDSQQTPVDKTPPKSERDFSRHHAFIVASQNYSRGFSLNYTENDAHLLRETLVNSGYPVLNITSYLNARLDDFRAGLKDWLAARGPQDTILVYFNGHGISIDGLGYYVPVDAKLDTLQADSRSRGVDVEIIDPKAKSDDRTPTAKSDKTQDTGQLFSLVTLAASLQNCPAKKKLLILDICSPQTTKLAAEVGAAIKSSAELLPASALGPQSTFATLAACRDNELSYESPELKHGVLTYWLCCGLAGHADLNEFGNNDGNVKLMETKDYVYTKVVEYGQHTQMLQHPVLVGHHLEGPMFITNAQDAGALPQVWQAKEQDAER